MDTLQAKGDWNIIKGNLTQKWANLTDYDLGYAEGEEEKLIGRIRDRTGESRDAVDHALKKSDISALLQLAFPLLYHTE